MKRNNTKQIYCFRISAFFTVCFGVSDFCFDPLQGPAKQLLKPVVKNPTLEQNQRTAPEVSNRETHAAAAILNDFKSKITTDYFKTFLAGQEATDLLTAVFNTAKDIIINQKKAKDSHARSEKINVYLKKQQAVTNAMSDL